MNLESIYLRINPARYHFLKFILEAYDGLCLLSTVPGKKGCVCIRYPHELAEVIYELLAALSISIKPELLPEQEN
jgi:hypothetical protein